jgi:hypothetical protein
VIRDWKRHSREKFKSMKKHPDRIKAPGIEAIREQAKSK